MSENAKIDEWYSRHIKPLSVAERRRLLALTKRDLGQDDTGDGSPERSLLELEGLGAEIWQGIDAQSYVNALRDEWERHP